MVDLNMPKVTFHKIFQGVGANSLTTAQIFDRSPFLISYKDQNGNIYGDKNNKVISNDTIVECSDKPKVRHFVKDAGIAKKCRPYQTVANIRGTQKNVQGFLCQFPDGSWQAVDGRYRY